MHIQTFLSIKGYSDNVKKGGVPFLLKKWKWINERIPYDERFTFEEYLNDLLTRSVIEEILINCDVDSKIKEELNKIDMIFKNKTVESINSLWSQDMIKDEHNWYYFRIPRERMLDWGITNEKESSPST